jgi:hypothetical protein
LIALPPYWFCPSTLLNHTIKVVMRFPIWFLTSSFSSLNCLVSRQWWGRGG